MVPLIYGMNGYKLDPAVKKYTRLAIDRWGGTVTSRHNCKLLSVCGERRFLRRLVAGVGFEPTTFGL